MALTLLLGGARSGKSALALRLASSEGEPVAMVATAEPGDSEMAERIRRHRSERPATWTTVEEPVDLEAAFAVVPAAAVVVVDCLTLWVSNLLERGASDNEILDRARRAAQLASARGPAVFAVTNEVGSGIVPANRLARRFRDLLGEVNSIWATAADRAALLVAGRVLILSDAEIMLEGKSAGRRTTGAASRSTRSR